MARNRIGTDGQLLEWAIQSDYVSLVKGLPAKYIPHYMHKKKSGVTECVPLTIQHHMGNANGGASFMTQYIDVTQWYFKPSGETAQFLIEFKRHNGVLSPEQKLLIPAMQEAGIDIEVHRSAQTAFDSLLKRIGLVNQRSKE